MNRAVALAALGAWAGACGSDDPQIFEQVCPEAEQRLGRRVCVHSVPNRETWTKITYSAAAVDQNRATTYLVPARPDARLPPLFIDAAAFERPAESLHFKFLSTAFPELGILDYDQYLELALDPDRREWFAGSITEFIATNRPPIFGFTIRDRAVDAATTVTCAQFKEVYGVLKARVRVGAVKAVPANSFQRLVLEACDVPWHDPSAELDYEVYYNTVGCGTLRRYTLPELASAEASAAFGWQDVLVTQEAPLDIATVISGIVTGTRQGELSHLNVRSASRGTPNCYVKGAYELLAGDEGKLVRLSCTTTSATVTEITPEEAQACWQNLRPPPVVVTPPDRAWTELVGLLDLPTASAAERRTGVSRFGGKGANLAALYQRIDPALTLQGFLIPLHYYDAFMAANGFAATIEGHLSDPQFLAGGILRRQRLGELVAAMEAAPCDAALVAALEARVLQVFGSADVMVRFRSSSNAEDALRFNGAGLYDSTSVCLADDGDADALGPSRCDPDQPSERGVCRGLTKVWASLWSVKAYEERDWYGIDHRQVAMGVLVDTRIKGELANIVAFTGNPLQFGDNRYLINAQLGELDVVSALPGVWPEKVLLTISGGQVAKIERLRGSTELPDGQWVLDDARLQELGASLAHIATIQPLDEKPPPTADVLFDTEWKIRPDGRPVIKQIRPFLRR